MEHVQGWKGLSPLRVVQEAVKLVKSAYARNGLLSKARTRGMDFFVKARTRGMDFFVKARTRGWS